MKQPIKDASANNNCSLQVSGWTRADFVINKNMKKKRLKKHFEVLVKKYDF